MSTSNPYQFDDFDESDLEELSSIPKKRQQKHVLDGSTCPACGVPHDVIGAENIPEDVLEEVASKFFDDLPAGTIRSEVVIAGGTHERTQLNLLKDFAHFAWKVTETRRSHPVIRAVAEILDDMTDGHVTRLWRLYDAEFDLQVSHVLFRTITSIQESFQERGPDNPDDAVRIERLLTILVEMSEKRIDASRQRYVQRARQADRIVDEQLLVDGTYVPAEGEENEFASNMKMTADKIIMDFLFNDQN